MWHDITESSKAHHRVSLSFPLSIRSQKACSQLPLLTPGPPPWLASYGMCTLLPSLPQERSTSKNSPGFFVCCL